MVGITLRALRIDVPQDTQIIAGQGTFNLLAIEELHKAIATGAPNARFGVSFTEGSDARLIRSTGTDNNLISISQDVVKNLNAGHYFIILMQNAYPLQVLNNIKLLGTTVNLQVATGNQVNAIVADLPGVSAVIGYTDGLGPREIETGQARSHRRRIVRKIGYLEQE